MENNIDMNTGAFIPEGQAKNLELVTTQPTITRLITPFEALVSEDAQAEIGCIPDEMKKYEAQGFFEPTVGMLQILNKFSGRLFAYVQENENGKRDIRFIQQYQDGRYSPEFSISQSDLLTVALGSMESNLQDSETKRDCRRCLRRIRTDYLNKCCGKEIPNILEVITSLAEVLSKLPVVSERSEMSRAQLYSEVLKVINFYCSEVSRYYRRGGYFILTEQEVGRIAREMEMNDKKLLELLKKNRLLYLTDSCCGYQVKVPTHKDEKGNAIFEWCYCLLDMEYFSQKLDPQRANAVDKLTSPLQNWDE